MRPDEAVPPQARSAKAPTSSVTDSDSSGRDVLREAGIEYAVMPKGKSVFAIDDESRVIVRRADVERLVRERDAALDFRRRVMSELDLPWVFGTADALTEIVRLQDAMRAGVENAARLALHAEMGRASAPQTAGREAPLLDDAQQTARYLRRLSDEIDRNELTLHWRQDREFLALLAREVECRAAGTAGDDWHCVKCGALVEYEGDRYCVACNASGATPPPNIVTCKCGAIHHDTDAHFCPLPGTAGEVPASGASPCYCLHEHGPKCPNYVGASVAADPRGSDEDAITTTGARTGEEAFYPFPSQTGDAELLAAIKQGAAELRYAADHYPRSVALMHAAIRVAGSLEYQHERATTRRQRPSVGGAE